MTVTESKPASEKLDALFLALKVVTIQQYRGVARGCSELEIERLLRHDTDPQLPYQVWSGLEGKIQETFFKAWTYEIGQAGSSTHKMVEGMTGGK